MCDIGNRNADVTADIKPRSKAGPRARAGQLLGVRAAPARFRDLREYSNGGLLLTPAVGTPKAQLERLLEWRVPLVQVTRCVAGVETDFVGNDNRQAARMATRHLLALGHRNIGYIGLNRRRPPARTATPGSSAR
jgi:DNA-binding LacI/PurR family transcriptional regulator